MLTKKATAMAIACLLTLLATGTVVALTSPRPTDPAAAALVSAPPTVTEPQVPALVTTALPTSNPSILGAKIKVGIIVSDFSATGPHDMPSPFGYANQIRRISELRDPSIEIYPIIDPGSENAGQLPSILHGGFPTAKPINGADLDELRKLDVILTNYNANMRDDVLLAIESAVNGGVGLIWQGAGSITPGYTPVVKRLAGMSDAEYGWNPGDVDCQVVGDHPLLGSLAGQTHKNIRLMPNGACGVLNGVPLLCVSNTDEILSGRKLGGEKNLYPLYISQLGKGRIVGIAFAHYVGVPGQLQKAHNGRFYIHCVQWAAGRPLQ